MKEDEKKSATFEMFWAIYPKKVAMGAAKRAWAKIGSYDKEAIIKILSNGYRFTKDRQFIPYPATWLNQERWLDEQDHDDHDLAEQQVKQKANDYKALKAGVLSWEDYLLLHPEDKANGKYAH